MAYMCGFVVFVRKRHEGIEVPVLRETTATLGAFCLLLICLLVVVVVAAVAVAVAVSV